MKVYSMQFRPGVFRDSLIILSGPCVVPEVAGTVVPIERTKVVGRPDAISRLFLLLEQLK